jgi:hypothetical protein
MEATLTNRGLKNYKIKGLLDDKSKGIKLVKLVYASSPEETLQRKEQDVALGNLQNIMQELPIRSEGREE